MIIPKMSFMNSGARVTAPLSSSFSFPLASVLLFSSCFFACSKAPPPSTPDEWKQVALSGETMGTTYHVKIVVPESETPDPQTLKKEIDQDLEAFNQLLSTWDPDSEISKFNLHDSSDPFPVSPATLEILKTSFELFEQSEGAFDPTVGPLIELWGFGKEERGIEPPPADAIAAATSSIGMDHLEVRDGSLTKALPHLQLNLSAIAKGYGVDVIARVLEERGYEDLMVEIGGEVVVRGKNLKRSAWTIGVDSPWQTPGKRELIEVLALDECAAATSGDYRNAFEYDGILYSHIIDPKTGWPVPESVKSVTVIASSCMLADGAATTIMAMGAEKGLDWAEQRKDLEALIFVRDDGIGVTRYQTSGMEKFLQKE